MTRRRVNTEDRTVEFATIRRDVARRINRALDFRVRIRELPTDIFGIALPRLPPTHEVLENGRCGVDAERLNNVDREPVERPKRTW